MDGRIDRRVIKTKERLYEVFIKLLAEKPVQNITVKELSEKADINRATFYLHYNDVFDLLAQIEQEVITEFSLICDELNVNFTDEDFLTAYTKLLDFIKENKALCAALFGSYGDKNFFEKLVKIIMDKCFSRDYYTRYGFAFALAGCAGIIMNWVSYGMDEPSDVVANNTLTMIKKVRA